MPTYECVIALVSEPNEEMIVTVEAAHNGEALVENVKLRPGTYVKAIREITSSSN